MDSVTERLRIGASVENLALVDEWVSAFCSKNPSAGEFSSKINLIIEELMLNLIQFGYGDKASASSIWLTLQQQSAGVSLMVEDLAPPFNPFENDDAKTADLPEGGLGIPLTQGISSKSSYVRDGQYNRVTVLFGTGQIPEYETQTETSPKPVIRISGLSLWVVMVMIVLTCAGLAMAATLNYLKFQDIMIDTASARYDPVLHEVERSISVSLESGVPLSSLVSTKNLVERVIDQSRHAFSLIVTDPSGKLLFGTKTEDYELVDDEPPEIGKIRHILDQQGLFLSQKSIVQNDRIAGILTLAYDSTRLQDNFLKVADQLQRAVLYSLIPVLPLLVLVVVLMIGRLEGYFWSRLKFIRDVVQPDKPDPGPGDPLARSIWRLKWPQKGS
ncbi:MAG: ATP-binding protein [Gammaproteobacteria bacterium]|nr:ATP-binding protein [Gammaproteobacteria bacterium]MCY4228896.1 ATP-binding protein [Gammaproteobacteria bacterium]